MEVDNSSQRDFGLIGTKVGTKAVKNLAQKVGTREMSVIEARCVDKGAYVYELLAFYTY
jgi:hypothetical protein